MAILEVLREKANAIRVEDPGILGEGVEFYVQFPTHTIYHQVKRQQTATGWTIASLNKAGVLPTFQTKLQDSLARCVFVSAHSATGLEELTNRARTAISVEEFETACVSSQSLRDDSRALRRLWGNDTGRLMDFLRRVKVETIGEDSLRRWATVEAERVLSGDRTTALATLVELVLDGTNEFLTPQEIWRRLATKNYTPSRFTSSDQSTVHVANANKRYRESRQATLIRGQLIARDEAIKLAEAVDAKKLVLLDGVAGTGKSDVLLQYIQQLENAGSPYLAFRLDRTDPTRDPDQLGQQLRLPASPATTLATVAQDRPAVLIIDQLDAVSQASGRNPQFLECIEEVVRTAYAIPSLRVVLACRTFDIKHDAHIRRLLELGEKDDLAQVTVDLLPLEKVKAALLSFGRAPEAFSSQQLELLRVPFHLALVSGLSTESNTTAISNAADLLGAFWREQKRNIDHRIGGESNWVAIVRRLAQYMSEHQALRAPAAIVDQWDAYAEAMISARVLTRDGQQLAFFHETFFDYVFARQHVGSDTLASLLAQDQLLFRRGQVRQILAYEREAAPSEYKRDLRHVLFDASIRFHIKHMVAGWLSHLEPTAFEWALLAPVLEDSSHELYKPSWRVMFAEAWFKFADARGWIEQRLVAEDHTTEWIAAILGQLVNKLPSRVAVLVSSRLTSPEWQRRIGGILLQADLSKERALFDLYVRSLIDREPPPDSEDSYEFGNAAQELRTSNPSWACEMLALYIEHRTSIAWKRGCPSPFQDAKVFPRNLHLGEFIFAITESVPEQFIDRVFPTMLEILRRTSKDVGTDRLVADTTWHRFYFTGQDDFDEMLFRGAERSFGKLAERAPDRFITLLNSLQGENLETVAHLLFEGFRGNPSRLADLAIEYLLTDHRRFRVRLLTNDYWGTRRMLEAITPYAAAASLERLEQALLSYYPDWVQSLGEAQFALLGGIAVERRSPIVQKRLQELRRKFGTDDAPEPEEVEVVEIVSPIPNEAAQKMDDEQWLRAVDRYSAVRARGGRDWRKGGAEELARVLGAQAKELPERFARLALKFDDDVNDAYFDAILRSVQESKEPISVESAVELVERCHLLPNRPCGRWIAGPLLRNSDADLPTKVLEIVGWYAEHDPDPEEAREPSESFGGDLLHQGLNSARGAIAGDIAKLVASNINNLEVLEPFIRLLANDRVPAVRTMAAEIVCALVISHPELASELFVQLVANTDDRVLSSYYVGAYLQWQLNDDFALLRPVVERMLKSEHASVRKAGSIHMTRTALRHPEARDAAEACLASPDQWLRHGAAKVYASNLSIEEHSERCTDVLITLFEDAVPEIRKTSGDAIWRLSGTELGDHIELATRFLNSQVFVEHPDDLVHPLKESTAPVSSLILSACHRLLAEFENQRVGRLGYVVGECMSLVIRAYADTDERSQKEATLDLIDRSLRLDVYGTGTLLAEHDRWWGS